MQQTRNISLQNGRQTSHSCVTVSTSKLLKVNVCFNEKALTLLKSRLQIMHFFFTRKSYRSYKKKEKGMVKKNKYLNVRCLTRKCLRRVLKTCDDCCLFDVKRKIIW